MSGNGAERETSRSDSMRAALDTLADQFEAAWLAGEEPSIEDYIALRPSDQPSDVSRQILLELVMIDLEHRWRRATEQGENAVPGPTDETREKTARPSSVTGPCLENYVRRYPTLGSLGELPSAVIAFEYRVRHVWGDRPSHEHYLERFPAQAGQLASVLADTDKGLGGGTSDAATTQHMVVIQRQLGRYQLLEELGRGGMGAVYRALHTKLGCHVAVKVMRDDLNDEPEAVARFQREMKAVGGLSHPNLVRALDADQIAGTHVLVMEYVDGIDVATLLRRTGPLPIADACELIRQTALGLEYAHQRGLVHRDIKPSNLMLAVSDQPSIVDQAAASPLRGNGWGEGAQAILKVLDLGLASLRSVVGEVSELTRTGQLMGTLDYIAPEQTLDPHNVDARADIYSLGCTLYELLCGEAPFGGPDYDSVGKKIVAHTQHEPTAIGERRGEVPRELAAIVHRMLAKEPAKRFATAAEAAAVLGPFAEGHDLDALSHSYRVAPELAGSRKDKFDETEPCLTSALTGTQSELSRAPPIVVEAAIRRWKSIAGAVLLLSLIGVLVAWQIVSHFSREDRVTVVGIPGGSTAKVHANGSEEMNSPGQDRQMGLTGRDMDQAAKARSLESERAAPRSGGDDERKKSKTIWDDLQEALPNLSDPSNQQSPYPCIKRACEIKRNEETADERIEAVVGLISEHLATETDRDGYVTQAVVAAMHDATERVRIATVEAVADWQGRDADMSLPEPIARRLMELVSPGKERFYDEPSERVRRIARQILIAAEMPPKQQPASPPPTMRQTLALPLRGMLSLGMEDLLACEETMSIQFDSAALESNVPAVRTAAEIQANRTLRPLKILALKYLDDHDWFPYYERDWPPRGNPNGRTTSAFLAATEDLDPPVKLAAVKLIGKRLLEGRCQLRRQQLIERLRALSQDPSERVREVVTAILAEEAKNQSASGNTVDYGASEQ